MTPEEKAKMFEAIGYHEGQGDPTLPTEVCIILTLKCRNCNLKVMIVGFIRVLSSELE